MTFYQCDLCGYFWLKSDEVRPFGWIGDFEGTYFKGNEIICINEFDCQRRQKMKMVAGVGIEPTTPSL